MKIKFRAKDEDTGYWQFGYYVFHQKVTPCVGTTYDKDNDEHMLLFDGFSDWSLPRPWYKCNINSDTLGQFTNILDIDKNEIYVGDILKDKLDRCWIIFCAPGGFCVCNIEEWIETKGNPIVYSGLSELQNASWTTQNCKIIGNRYDNPELLTGGNYENKT